MRARYPEVMPTGTLISEEEYLHTSYEPDCEFEDGVVIERNVGTFKHSELQGPPRCLFYAVSPSLAH